MNKWLTTKSYTVALTVVKSSIATIKRACRAVQPSNGFNQGEHDAINPFGRCHRRDLRRGVDNDGIHFHAHSATACEVSIDMDKNRVNNNNFGAASSNQHIERETSKENGMVSTCLFNPETSTQWIEITFNHNDAEMRHFRH